MPTIKKVKGGFHIQHTTREVWGVDDPLEEGEHEADCQCRHCAPASVAPVDRTTELRRALLEINALQIASHRKTFDGDNVRRGRYDVYLVNGRMFIVDIIQSRIDEPESWDILVPVCADTRIDATIAALKTWAKSAS